MEDGSQMLLIQDMTMKVYGNKSINKTCDSSLYSGA